VNQCDAVIVNFNAGEFLKEAVKSVLRSASLAHVYVVDNASTDSSLDFLPQDHRLTIIPNAANLGFAAAANIGLARATSDAVLLLNPDADMTEGTIEHLITALWSADNVGMVGPLLLNPDGTEQAGGRRKFPMPPTALEHALAITWVGRYFAALSLPPHLYPLPQKPIEIDAISGACMMVRRAAMAAVGLLDERYFLHCEDLDWCLRFRQHGWTILFVPEARVIHHKGMSSKDRALAVEYYKHRSMVQFYRKHLSSTYPRWLLALTVVGVWLRFAAFAIWRLLP
jgi:GT2 family glycosyltransferase